jgi:hypothetical protein
MNRLTLIAYIVGTLTYVAVVAAQAEPLHARKTFNAQGSNSALAAQRGLVADGQGNVNAGSAGAFNTSNGQGLRTSKFQRSSDGSINASSQGNASGANGSASSNSSYTRSADGSSASGSRNTSATNSNTGVSYDGSTTYTKGSGFSRSGSCTDLSGNTVTCGSAR